MSQSCSRISVKVNQKSNTQVRQKPCHSLVIQDSQQSSLRCIHKITAKYELQTLTSMILKINLLPDVVKFVRIFFCFWKTLSFNFFYSPKRKKVSHIIWTAPNNFLPTCVIFCIFTI